jgi:uncharacterized protein YfaS (alpha-2-macroglobulin family)
MRRQHLLNWTFIAILLLTPILSACQRGRPAAQPAAPAPAAAVQPAAASTAAPGANPPAPPDLPTAVPSPTPTRAPLPPIVVQVTPEVGQVQGLDAPVVVTFDQPMETASTRAAFGIEPKVPGEVKVQGAKLTFTPSQELRRNTAYTVTVTSTATSAGGLKLAAPVAYRFTTVGYVQVTNTQPADKTQDVPVDSKITVSFNRPIVPLTGISDTAGLPTPLVITPSVTGTGTWLNTGIYQFTPQPGLDASTDYTVTVLAGLQDTTGAVLADPYTFGFRTAAPIVTSWLPQENSNIKPNEPITATFSMSMDRASTEAAFRMVDANNQPVAGSLKWDKNDTALGFWPDKPWAFGTRYSASLEQGARPANGSATAHLNGVTGYDFTTVSTPKIISTQPPQNSQAADPMGSVVFRFASPINPATLVTGTWTILPKPTQVMTGYNDYQNEFYLLFMKEPAAAYTITLSGKIADPYGNTLGKDYVLHFTTRNYDPLLQLNAPGNVGTFNAYTNTQAFVTYRNQPAITFDLYKVPVETFIRLTGNASYDAWRTFRPNEDQLLRQWSVQTKAKPNETGFLRIDLANQAGQQLSPGMYYLTMTGSAPMPNDPNAGRELLARTDLNLTLKSNQTGALAWVTDLKSGLPVPGITVRFTDGAKLDASAQTDKDGIATVTFGTPRHQWDPLAAIATGENGEFGVASNNWEDGIAAWNFNLPSGTSPAYNGYIYTDRPLYRPGQTVYWKTIIRRDNDALYALPAPGQAVTVTIRDDQGNELTKQSLTLDPLGTLNGQFALSLNASLGFYSIAVDVPPTAPGLTGDQLGWSTGFQVAEYRKPEYEISATTDKPEYTQGQMVNVTAQANYFFGGAVKNAKVRWVLTSADYAFQWSGKGNYSFTDWDWYNPNTMSFGGPLGQGTGTTDANGRFTFSVPADIAKFTQSQRFTFDITVEDINNQSVSTQATAIVHKGLFYIGLHPQSYVATVGDQTGVDVLTVDTQGNPAPSTPLTLTVNQVEWYSVREQMEDGRYYWTTKARETPVFTKTLTTNAQGTATLLWTPEQGGEYKVKGTAIDRAGNVIRSAAYIWVSGKQYVNWRQDNNDRLQLVADKDSYQVGDTAQLLIASPYQTPVKALLTIERDHIFTHQVIEIAGNSQTLKVPIEAAYAPDVFVSLMLVKGMDKTSPAPSFKVGLAQLKVSVADKALQVLVTPQTVPQGATRPGFFGPRDTITWTVKTLDAAGKPVAAQVSLALVDKALLSMTSDQSGTLLDRFYAQRPLGVRTASTLVVNVDRVTAQLSQGGKGGGGGGCDNCGPGGSVRSQFADLAYWTAALETGVDGTKTVSMTLPDNLTTWTMDARAVTANTLVGQATTDITATKDLLISPVLPRFFVEGDQAEISAVIHNNTKNALDVTVNLHASGLKLPAETQSQVSVAAGSTYKAAWPVTVPPNTQQITVTMSAAGGSLSDAVQITLPVYRYTTPQVTGTAGQVAQGETRLELVRLPADADPTRGQLDVNLEPSLAAGMTGGLTYLEHFPYECVEQTVSRFLPNVMTYEALKKLGISRPDLEAKLPQQVSVGLQRIYNGQHLDGGWGWWQTDESNAAVSAYVVFGLARAQAAGFSVDKDVLARGVRYLKGTLTAPAGLNAWELNRQAFTVYALAEAGDLEPNRAGGLFEQHARLSTYAKAYLAMALGLINDGASAARIQTLLAEINNTAVTSATSTHWEEDFVDYWNMNTDTRTTAIVLEALVRLDPQNTLAPNAVRWLMTARKADRWETTQENAWAIMSLTDWMAATGELQGSYTWQVELNNQLLGQGSVTPANVSNSIDLSAGIARLLLDQTNGLTISRATTGSETGKGQLYYTVHLQSYEPVEKIAPVDRGIVVSRQYRMAECINPTTVPTATVPAGDQSGDQATAQANADKNCPSITQARVGDVISVKLNIVVPHALQYVAVEDPLPAGTEAVDTSLRTTSANAQGPQLSQKPGDAGPAKPAWDWWWTPTHTDLRDEKVTLFATNLAPGAYEFTYEIRASLPGKFLTLPPSAYEMYFPEVWGRGAGSVFTVTQ